MKTTKANKIAALTTAGAIAFANLGVAIPTFAATEGSTQLNLTVNPVTVDYELIIPGETTVSSSGFSNLASPLGIKNLTVSDRVNKIRVDVSTDNNWQFKKNPSDEDGIAYDLREGENQEAITKYDFTNMAEMATEAGENVSLGINVESYDDKEEGNYEDSIKWTTTVDRKVEEVKIKDCSARIDVKVGESLELEAEISPAGLSVVYDWETYHDDEAPDGGVSLDEVEGSPNKIKITGDTLGEIKIKVKAGGQEKPYKVRVTNTN